MPAEPNRSSPFAFVLVAAAAWIFPGAGYLMIGQRARGITIGLTVLALFFFGLLIGGVRCLEVPGYDAHGGELHYYIVKERDKNGTMVPVVKLGKLPKPEPKPEPKKESKN